MQSPAADLTHAGRMLGVPLDAQQVDSLARFLSLLQRWNATYNLTSIRDPAQMLTHHLFDCLAVVPALTRRLDGLPKPRLLDVGSGAGLPGVVIAVALPSLAVTCVDAVGKKAAFVRQVAAELSLPNLRAAHARVEALREPPFDVIVSRAFASISNFVRSTRHLLAPEGSWLAMKGKAPAAEMSALQPGLRFHVEPLNVPGLDADRCLVWVDPLS